VLCEPFAYLTTEWVIITGQQRSRHVDHAASIPMRRIG
jgi:hypothetical protein